MLTSWMQVLERLGDARLERWARDVHVAVLAALVIYFLAPLIAAIIRRLPSRPERLWVRMWICPVCEQLNRRTYANCQRCEHNLPLRWRDRWEMSAFAEGLRNASRRLNRASRYAAYFFYYCVPAVALIVFRLYRVQQLPLEELIGSFALGFLLLFFLFLRAAVHAGWRAPVTGLISLIAGLAMLGGFLSASLFWAAAPVPPEKPIATVSLTPDGRIRWEDRSGRKTLAMAAPALADQLPFQVRYSVVTWPLLDVRRVVILEVESVPAAKPWVAHLLKRAAARLNGTNALQPRVTLLNQTLSGVPSRSAEVIVPSSGAGLVLRQLPAPAKPIRKTKN